MATVISWNEIRTRAIQFSRDWAGEESERAEAQTFWNEFFNVFGITRRRVAVFEKKVDKLKNKHGRIDLFWPGQLLAEHKSRGEDLEAAFEQATDYFAGLDEKDLPQYIVVSDFEKIRIVDLENNTKQEFHLKDFHKYIKLFGFIAGYQKKEIKSEDPVNIKAANRMADLHKRIEGVGYSGHELEIFLVRILFCFFADDSGIFEKGIFREFIEERTKGDGSDLGQHLQLIFQILNTPDSKRLATLDEELQHFPYVDGILFHETLPIVSFNSDMRDELLKAAAFDWSIISPAVFGSMFQSIMDPIQRRNIGAHYTSEKNIMKVIQSLFLDELQDQFKLAGNQKNKLEALLKKLADINLLDPACGCGNFLVISYRELRRLELEVLKKLHHGNSESLFGGGSLTLLNVDQFFGIEKEEFAARIAETALWLMDHQMNLEVGEVFGKMPDRLPLKTSAKIEIANALRIDWDQVMGNAKPTFILGNPPFVGSKFMMPDQRDDITHLFPIENNGILDYVSGWYAKAAEYIQNSETEVAFVSTNSITQGEQVGVLWKYLIDKFEIKINFAHKTFKWTNDAKGKAGVYCVIIGFGIKDRDKKFIYEYESVAGDPHGVKVGRINPYLADANDLFILSRSKPICDVPTMNIGSKPIDDGNYLFTLEGKNDFLKTEPGAEKYFRRWIGSQEFINRIERWCLWVGDAKPEELRQLPNVLERIDNVRQFRSSSKSKPTQKLADSPTRFHIENLPTSPYIFVPRVSSENRFYIPIGFVEPFFIPSDSGLTINKAEPFHFGILESKMHMIWVKYICGRLKSDYRYSKDIVYNNFPWPEKLSDENIKKIEIAANNILEIRQKHSLATLADLYDPDTMPSDLLKAHKELDGVVDKCYRSKSFVDEHERISFLFDLYQKYLSNDSTKLLLKSKKKVAK